VNPVRAVLGSWLLLALVVGARGWFERATAADVAATVLGWSCSWQDEWNSGRTIGR
jgi:hypothetical protein